MSRMTGLDFDRIAAVIREQHHRSRYQSCIDIEALTLTLAEQFAETCSTFNRSMFTLTAVTNPVGAEYTAERDAAARVVNSRRNRQPVR